jgi:hypothetical protein
MHQAPKEKGAEKEIGHFLPPESEQAAGVPRHCQWQGRGGGAAKIMKIMW